MSEAMNVDKGEVITLRLRVESPEEAGPFLGELTDTMRGGRFRGLVVTASARGDVFAERDELLDEDDEDDDCCPECGHPDCDEDCD